MHNIERKTEKIMVGWRSEDLENVKYILDEDFER